MPVTDHGAADFATVLSCSGRYEQQVEAIKGLLTDIEEDRLLHPIVVRRNAKADGSPYELVSGWLVWSAAIYLQKESINAIIWEGDDLESTALVYRLNHHRVQMKRSESKRIAQRVAALLVNETGEATYREVATTLGCSLSWAHKLLHDGEDAASLYDRAADGSDGRRRRGRPPVAPVFSLQISDPSGWESSVRLRVVIQGREPNQDLRLQLSEESDRWQDVEADEFLKALETEVERLSAWVRERAKDPAFFPEKNSRAPVGVK
ncbi:MAG: ParB N-terminal domain-containing protein [Chloroflexi bacterium]|nr:ParB N-terminal domain-containing protein [Chloroflexota bacterium]